MSNNKYPSPYDFFINTPIYEKIVIDESSSKIGMDIFNFGKPFDSYCPFCKEHSIFERIVGNYWSEMKDSEGWVDKGDEKFKFRCTRVRSHLLEFYVRITDRTFEKVGQTPSIADLQIFDVKKYSKILPKQYYMEFTKAIGLASHGVGVGSFVYLRRIFEQLISEAKLQLCNDASWDEELFNRAKMSEKIELVASELPEFLVENKLMYGILSKGIHELSEQECLQYFPVVKTGIEIILDSHLEKLQRQEKLNLARKALASVSSKI
jgi:hypothetical protein